MTLAKRTRQYECLPPGHGVVYNDFYRNETVTAPLGINLVLRGLWHLRNWVAHPFKPGDAASRAEFYRSKWLETLDRLKEKEREDWLR